MRIFHISDTHVGSESHFNSKALEGIVEEANSGDYDLLIHTGDLTQSGRVEEFERSKEILSRLELPYIVLPGNHDARSGGLSLFERYIGPTSGVRLLEDAVIIHVNSAFADSDQGRVGMVKFNMIREALNRYSEKGVKVVAIHHHIVPVPKGGRERNILFNAGDMLDLITKADVDLVLSGHRHYPNIYRIGNTVFLNAGTASARKTRYGDLNSYDSVRIGQGEMWVTSKRVDGAVTLQSFPRREKRVFSDLGRRLFRLIHISNTFITDSKGFLEPHFDNAMAKIRDLGPDLVVHCGGVVREGIPHDYEKAREKLSSVDGPMVFTPAGRDINYLGYHLFERTFGPFDQSYSDGEILFQGISSAQYDSPTGIVGPTERRELLETLGSSGERMRGVFLHHNVLPIPHSREKGLLEDSGDLLKNLVDAQVDLVLTGTSSHPHAARVDHTVVVNANSLSSVYQRSLFGNSFNLIDIYERAIAVSEVNSLWGRRRLLGLWEHSRFELPRPRSPE